MTRLASDRWAVPAHMPVVQRPLEPATVRRAERALGVRPPASLLEVLRRQNGGVLRPKPSVPPESTSLASSGLG